MRDPDRAGFAEFATSRLAALRRLAYGVCGDWHEADDLVQATLTQAYLKWVQVRAADDLDKYVRGMLMKAFLTERRRPWARMGLFATPPEASRTAPAADAGADDRTVLWREIGRLPKRQRAVVVLRYACDMSVPEVAHALRCSVGTVKSNTHDALVSLRARLAAVAYPAPEGRRVP